MVRDIKYRKMLKEQLAFLFEERTQRRGKISYARFWEVVQSLARANKNKTIHQIVIDMGVYGNYE